MARDLQKFVNPRFLASVDLALLCRLFARQPECGHRIDLGLFDRPATEARAALAALFEGPEDALPPGLVADLHHIADLGTEAGMALLQERAALRGVVIAGPPDLTGQPAPLDPKQFALLAFLDHREVFDAATDLAALAARSSFAEYVGRDENVEPQLGAAARAEFQAAARAMLQRDHRGAHCRVGWYEDGDRMNLVVTHGAPVSVVPVFTGAGEEGVISFRAQEYAVLSYQAGTGRLGVAGLRQSLRAELAEMFAAHLLRRPGFFAGEDCQDLYTLERIERTGLDFRVEHAFDPCIRGVDIVEVQLDRLGAESEHGEAVVEASHVTRAFHGSALLRVREHTDRVVFGPGRYRIGHIVLRVHFAGRRRACAVTVKVKPPSLAVFKRQRFEARVMELLRRNGFCRDRQPGRLAAAA